jgi:hypothetical protein
LRWTPKTGQWWTSEIRPFGVAAASTDPAASKPAISPGVSTDSGPSKPATTVATSTDLPPEFRRPATPSPVQSPTASACEPYRRLIEDALGRGRNAMAIWQDLVDDHLFRAGYASVKLLAATSKPPFAMRTARWTLAISISTRR